MGCDAKRQADGSLLLEPLRAGRLDEILFLVPGLEGDTAELAPLVSAFSGPQEVVGVAPPLAGLVGPDLGVPELAAAMVSAVRSRQPHGPYRLGGYSFGALLALEMAHQLLSEGEIVSTLFLIEAIYDERYWPRPIWWRAIIRRSGRQLARIVRMPHGQAFGELRHRAIRLVQRVIRRRSCGAIDPLKSGETAAGSRAYAAISRYRPQYFPGRVTLIASTSDQHFGCDTARLWTGLAHQIDIQRVDGDHLTVLHDPAHAAVLAKIIDHHLGLSRPDWDGLRPRPGLSRPLLLTTMRWFSFTRLAHAMIESGFEVSACRPGGHTLGKIDGVAGSYRLNRLSRSRSVLRAIAAARPDIILPDDERALKVLRRLYARIRHSDPATAAILARSLGNVDDWASITSRTGLAHAALSIGIAAPKSEVVATPADLCNWVNGHGFPVVLKTDGSWGGRGVAIARSVPALRARWRRISSPPTFPKATKRLLVNIETDPIVAWAQRTRPVVNAQEYVPGREAMATVACLDGEVLGVVCLAVVQASEARGPAAVVRTIDHPGMADAARRLVAEFGLNGFCGFDFILDEDGEAWLIEMNPRVTPTSYLLVDGSSLTERTFALFPRESTLDDGPNSAAPCDQPVRAPALVRLGNSAAARHDLLLWRAARRLRKKLILESNL